jgi:3-methyladenine DNA glycosylase/8-oxoguanine DNA glycosylase
VLGTLPDDELMAELTAIPGIGPWTVQGALLIAALMLAYRSLQHLAQPQ